MNRSTASPGSSANGRAAASSVSLLTHARAGAFAPHVSPGAWPIAQPIWWTTCCRWRRIGVPVGTALAGRPPDRTRRAGLPHRAPTSGLGVEALGGVRM